ncbi:uncharacterized protein [Cicer arietinum]|uniref:Uncharacterized protein LOC101492571 isoform X2 n=1 Tax=Cicer arietinum TaxID=3827 RepID=A0A1S2YH92_CICAR|nr:uncharacterized protein LOC101492571 isoform X2 [Cicer arietinum]
MSLSLIQGYSSGEDEPQQPHIHDSDTEEEDDADTAEPSSTSHPSLGDRSIFDHLPPPPSASGLPSAFDAFSEIPGPPQFLNNSVVEYNPAKDADQRGGGSRRHRKEKKDLPTGAVVEAKAQLVGIHERVRSDINGGQPPTSAALSTSEADKRVPTATNPNAEDAAELLSVEFPRPTPVHEEWSVLYAVIVLHKMQVQSLRRKDQLSKTRKNLKG